MRPADLGYTMPAEWAPHSGCWMAWPTRIDLWGEHMEGARDDYARVAHAIARFEPVTMIAKPDEAGDAARRCGPAVKVVSIPIDDSWLRDSAPTFLVGPSGKRAAVPSGETGYCRSYVNFYIANGAIIAPAYGVNEDTGVFDALRQAYPDREIVPVALKDLFRGGGGIHCITQQTPLAKPLS